MRNSVTHLRIIPLNVSLTPHDTSKCPIAGLSTLVWLENHRCLRKEAMVMFGNHPARERTTDGPGHPCLSTFHGLSHSLNEAGIIIVPLV